MLKVICDLRNIYPEYRGFVIEDGFLKAMSESDFIKFIKDNRDDIVDGIVDKVATKFTEYPSLPWSPPNRWIPFNQSWIFPFVHGAFSNKIHVIKFIRDLTGLGLIEAKNLVDYFSDSINKSEKNNFIYWCSTNNAYAIMDFHKNMCKKRG